LLLLIGDADDGDAEVSSLKSGFLY
jgi:hypothetical protein